MPKHDSEYEVEFSPISLSDIEEIKSYISNNLENPIAADKIVRQFFLDIDNLALTPEIGIKVKNYTKIPNDYKFIMSGNYSIFYYTRERVIRIARVLYSKSDFISKLFSN